MRSLNFLSRDLTKSSLAAPRLDRRVPIMKLFIPIAVICLIPCMSRAATLNLATLSCGKYENEVLASSVANSSTDSINTVMWLFGFATAKSGAHDMYGDALKSFGFALDAECKTNPGETVLDALAAVKPDSKNPMDLTNLQCSAFESRHVELARSDPESANTIMMWLFGFAVAKSGSHLFDSNGLKSFEASLMADCNKYPGRNLFDALTAVKISTPKN
jgi:HdeA/HdeB family